VSIEDKARELLRVAYHDPPVAKGYAESVKGVTGDIFAKITDILGMDHLGTDAILEMLAQVDQKADELVDALTELEARINTVAHGILGI
jgi:hypothetical protein